MTTKTLECSICHKPVEEPAQQLGDKALCEGCYQDGWRLETCIHQETVAAMDLSEEIKP